MSNQDAQPYTPDTATAPTQAVPAPMPHEQQPPAKTPLWKNKKVLSYGGTALAALIIGVAMGGGASDTPTPQAEPAPVVTAKDNAADTTKVADLEKQVKSCKEALGIATQVIGVSADNSQIIVDLSEIAGRAILAAGSNDMVSLGVETKNIENLTGRIQRNGDKVKGLTPDMVTAATACNG